MKKIYQPIKKFALLLSILASASAGAQVTYCNSSAIYTSDEEIYNVMLNGQQTNPLYSFSNGCSTPAPGPGSSLSLYSNFKTLGSLAIVIKGATSTFSVAENECDGASYYYNGCAAWIDYNQDGTFAASEQIFVDNSTIISPRNINATFVAPMAALTGTTVMRVIVAEGYSGTSLTPCLSPGYGETEDYVVTVIAPTPCSGPPPANTLVTGTAAICPYNGTSVSMANSYTVVGINYIWGAATNSVGPYIPINTATNSALNTPTLNANTWFQATVTCANGGTTIINPVQVNVQPILINTVPYYEGFEGIANNNDLPNCSWARSNAATAQTYINSNTQNRIPRSGNKFASFYYSPTGTNYFYTNGIQLNAGVTYSASMWFTTEYYGYNTYSLSITVGPNQSPTGMVPVATLGYAASPNYKQLSNTFTVATSGVYYVGIRAISNGACCGYYLSWDDLSITVPCDLNATTINLSGATANSSVICSGQAVNLTASGASTYTWNNGSTSASISDMPMYNTSYVVSGTNTLTGCSATLIKNLTVNPSPLVNVFTFDPDVCEGDVVTLNAFGSATNYTWSTGANGTPLTLTVTTGSTYTVIGSNAYGCTSMATQLINVNGLPNIGANSSEPVSCQGDNITLTGSGGVTYQWMGPNVYIQGQQVTVSPNATTNYTVTGTDANGCSATAEVNQVVAICLGIQNQSGLLKGLSVYPNPNNGDFNVELKNGLSKTVELTDVTGRLIMTSNSSSDVINVNITNLANGIYYVKVKSDNTSEVLKVVKQ